MHHQSPQIPLASPLFSQVPNLKSLANVGHTGNFYLSECNPRFSQDPAELRQRKYLSMAAKIYRIIEQ
jgi:hypothetical protein